MKKRTVEDWASRVERENLELGVGCYREGFRQYAVAGGFAYLGTMLDVEKGLPLLGGLESAATVEGILALVAAVGAAWCYSKFTECQHRLDLMSGKYS